MFDDSEYVNYEEAKSEGREEGEVEYLENVQSIKINANLGKYDSSMNT